MYQLGNLSFDRVVNTILVREALRFFRFRIAAKRPGRGKTRCHRRKQVLKVRMTAGETAVLAFMIAIAGLATGQAAPLEEKTVTPSLVARFGKVIGAAYACPEIAQIRIGSVRKQISETLDADTADNDDSSSLIKIFDNNITLGFQAAIAKQMDCAVIERDLSKLEKINYSNVTSESAKGTPGQQDPKLNSQEILDNKSKQEFNCRSGISDEEIRFGIVAPFTGPSKNLGLQMKIGIETAFGAANAAGGLYGRQLKLFSADDGYEPSRTLEAMKELCDRHDIFAFIGNVGTPTAAVALPYALEKRRLFFGAFTGANIVRNSPPDRYVFNYRASYTEETDAAVNYLVGARGIKPEEIAVFAQDDSFGDAGYAGVTMAIQKLKGGKGDSTTFRVNYKRNTEDVARALVELRAYTKPIKAIVIVATYGAAARFIQKSRDLFPNLIYTNVSFVGSTALRDRIQKLNIKDTNDIIVTQVVPPVEGYSSFVIGYRTELSKYFPTASQDYVSLEGYVSARLMIEALKQTGPKLDTERLVETLENMHDVDLGLGFRINFSRDEHQGSHKVWATRLTESHNYEILRLE